MEIKTINQEGITIIEISGRFDGNTVSLAHEKVIPLIAADICLVLDLGNCSYISSAGLRFLLVLAKQISAKAGRGVLAGVSEEIRDVMEMTGFSHYFKTYETVFTAITNLRTDKL